MFLTVCEAALPTNERECGVRLVHPPKQCYGCCRHSSAVRAVQVLPTLLCMQATRCCVNPSAGGLCLVGGGTADLVCEGTAQLQRMHMTCKCHMLLMLCLWLEAQPTAAVW